MRTCHYIILEVEKNASDTDIKKAYRRKALEWHPDKNHHRIEESTKQFALIADAYEVLSDPHERAWYDSHRDAILRGDDTSDQAEGAAGTTSAELMKYFSSSIHKEFQDDKAGFFTIYRNIFEKLAQEEADAAANDRHEESTEARAYYPSFGMSTTAYDSNSDSDVKQFYNTWLTFSSQKSFSWCDKFRLSEAIDRRERRAMEKENKKFRDAARKEFNDTVLVLASYVRKRDPRFLAYQEHQKQKQKQVQVDTKARLEKEKELLRAKVEKFQEQEWTRVQDVDHVNGSGSDDLEEDDQEYECIICDKFFKSERQWKNHEKSKRHLKAVEDIRLEMLHEENQLMGQSADGDASISPEDEDDIKDQDDLEGEEEEEEELEMPSQKPQSTNDQEDPLSESDFDEADEPIEVVTPVFLNPKSKKKNKKKKVLTAGFDIDETEIDDLDQDGLADLLGSARLSSSSSPMGRSRGSTPNNRRSRSRKDQLEGDSDHEYEGTPQSTAPASRAESPDGPGGGEKVKKMSAKEKKKARSERAAIAEISSATASGLKPVADSSQHDGVLSSDEDSTRRKSKKGRGKRK